MSLKKWMMALTALIMTTQTAPAQAEDCGFDLCACDPCEGWTVYADYLYWKPRTCNLDYVIVSEEENVVTALKGVCPKWESGFRVGVQKACEDIYFGVHYTYFDSNAFSSIQADGHLLPTLAGQRQTNFGAGNVRYAEAEYGVTFNQIDIEAGYLMEVNNCLEATPHLGFRFASIDQSLEAAYSADRNYPDHRHDPSDRSYELYKKNDADFYGFSFGSKASYTFCDCVNLFGDLTYGIGVADIDRNYIGYRIDPSQKENKIEKSANLSTDCCWKSATFLDLTFGVSFPMCGICGVDWAIAVGYEFHHWNGLEGFLDYDSGNAASESHIDHHSNSVGFDGLFVRIATTF